MSATEEIAAALQATENLGLPRVYTASIDTNGCTMMGITATQLLEPYASNADVAAVGSNCGIGTAEVVAAIALMHRENPDAVLVAKANCGIPEWVDNAIRYNDSPEQMQAYLRLVIASGARIIGGCCGTSYQHLAAMRQAMDECIAQPLPSTTPTLDMIENTLGSVSEGLKRQWHGQWNRNPAATETKRRRRRRA